MQLFWQCDQAKSSWYAIRCLTKSALEFDFNLNPCFYVINEMAGKSAEYQLRWLILQKCIPVLRKKWITINPEDVSGPTIWFPSSIESTLKKKKKNHVFSPLLGHLEKIDHWSFFKKKKRSFLYLSKWVFIGLIKRVPVRQTCGRPKGIWNQPATVRTGFSERQLY